MKKLFPKELIFLLLISISFTVCAQDGKFSFTLASNVNTSAGVYESDSILVRTLWNNVKYSAGTYTKYWDGKDDQGNPLTSPAANYTIKVLRNNVSYKWQGTIGNTSDSMTGETKHRGYYNCMKGLAFGPNYGYFCTGYSEGSPSVGKFSPAAPNTKINFLPSKTMTANTDYVATDGVYVYWGAYDANANSNTFVYGTRVSDDLEPAFSSGVSYTVMYGKTYAKAISILTQSNSYISGLAVQKNGNFLFVARSGLNQLQVLNKTTGALLQTLIYISPRGLSVDANGNLWMASGTNTVAKYTVNSNGILSTAIITLPGFIDPLATQVSADGTLISVADGGNSQQVKFFNNNTGASTSTLGVAGGYFTDASVNDNKFYFNDARGNQLPFIAYQPDGSFWVNDPGNFRVQHYSSSRNFINRVMSMGATYAATVDRNNIKRTFANFLEFSIDYSIQNLSGKQGWTLVKNWGANVTSAFDKSYSIRQQITLSNGRTYGVIRLGIELEIVEFPTTGPMRFTGVMFSLSKILCTDGSLQDYELSGGVATYKRYPLAGFDVSGNPSWNTTPEILAVEKTDIVVGSPINFPNSQIFNTTNKVVFYNHKAYANNVGPVYSTGYHLGLAARGTTDKFLFKTEKSTHRNYAGEFPQPGWFDEGNLVNDFAGGNVNIVDRNIITSYHGEFWKNSQTNYYNHYYDNGLAIGQFGTDRIKVGVGVHAAAMMAGNALTPVVAKDSNGDLYLYHGDESDHSGVHRWKISGLNTIAEDKIVIPYPAAYIAPISKGNDLMTGLPFSYTLVNNTAGWTRTPANEILTNKFSDYWNINTGVLKFNPLLSTDIHVLFAQPSATEYYLNRDLGNNNVTKDWSITGKINFKGRLNGGNNNYYIEVLDDAAKVLTSFYGITTLINYPVQSQKLFVNTTVVLSKVDSINNGPSLTEDFNKITDFNISVAGGKVTFTYGNYAPVTTNLADVTANWTKPKTVRIRFRSNGTSPNNNISVDISDFIFAKDTATLQSSNQAPIANAGTDQVITLPVSQIKLSGSGIDNDGTVVSYNWTKISGPALGSILTANKDTTTIIGFVQGIYQYALTVTDNNGAVGTDTVKVTVNAAGNQAPTANAGNDQVLTLPTALTTLNGSGTDTDGTISSYAWTKISGPSSVLILSPDKASTIVNNWLKGVYQYELVVTDNNGATGKDTVQVTVLAAPNVLPVADAGIDQFITLPQSNTTLSGAGADSDGTITNYSWTQISGPTTASISSPGSASSAVGNLSAGIYLFELSVTDNAGAISKDTVSIKINPAGNQAPTSYAGVDQVITLPTDSTTLSGSGTDADGVVSGYSWQQIGGPSLSTIVSPASAITAIKNLVQGVYIFEIKVIDNDGASSTDSITVIVNNSLNQAPVADAGTDQVIVLPINSVTLSGNGFDADGTITSYGWVKISGPAAGVITAPGFATTQVNNLVKGVYEFELTVLDNKGATATDTVRVTVNDPVNQAPVANAGTDQVINLPANSTTISGSATDIDGTIAGYAWVKIAGPAGGTISSPASATTAIDNLIAGIYQFKLTVTDDDGAMSSDTIMITVVKAPNQAPVADAGGDQLITLPVNSTTLTGSGIDFDGTIASYSWNNIAGPVAGTISSSNSAVTSISGLSEGTYQFELTVTDNDGASSTDTLTVIVNPAPNQAPVANAGNIKVITLPVDSTILSGTGTDADGTIVNYSWSQLSGPAACTISSPASAVTSIKNLVQGLYELELSVTDNDGAISKDKVQITVNDALNVAPVAFAGNNQVITLPVNTTMLTGIGTDIDGVIVSYSWTKISGPASGSIATANAATTPVDNLVQGIYKFELTVTDDDGAIAKNIVQVTVNAASNQPPVANAGVDQVIIWPLNSAILIGSGTDADGTITSYKWSKIAGSGGNISAPNSATVTAKNLTQGVYLFKLTVKDNSGASASDTIQVTVTTVPNKAPVTNAGADIIITLPTNYTTLNGSATDADGTISSYTWTKISGSGGSISTPKSGVTSITNLTSGIYYFELKAIDNNGAYSTDTVMVTVNNAPNQAPTTNAGIDQVITLPLNNTVLNGVGFDADGTIVSYSWSQLSGPAVSVIGSSNSANTTANNLVQGVYLYQLTVTDNDGAIASDTISILVNASPNQAPVVDAGSDQVITLPVNSTTLSGNATDADGTIVDYIWTKISGPVAGSITTPTSAASSVNNLVQGFYQFELTVTDNDGAVSKDTLQVTVNDALNQAPVAIAGTNQVITLPINSVTLTGSGTDADGTIVSYSWIKISGPAAGSIASANTAGTSVDNLAQGIYKYELTVTDDDGAISKDVVQVTVNKALNQAPVAIAGINQVITLPTNSAILTGSGTDADGTIVSYSWMKISGPAFGVIVSPKGAVTQISNLVQGVYLFQLTVTDNDGASSIALVQVTVNAAPNQAPVANAGSDILITLPLNYTSLNGTAVDPDGTIASYAWVKISGPANVTISSPNSGSSAVIGLVQGVYLFELTAKDNVGAIAKDTVMVTVNTAPNQPPSADAGMDQTITLPVNSTTLNGIGTDADGTISNVQWIKISGPAAGSIALPNAAITNINSLAQGVYKFEFTATDNNGATAKDTVTVTVNATPNLAPVANAGTDIVITLPVNTTSLAGNGTDADGFIINYSWVKVSGPTGGNIVSPNGSTTAVNNLIQGIYQFELTVTDDDGAISRDIVQVIVNKAPNQAPVANAGADQAVTLPVNSVILAGTATDADGTITNYKWIKISGPASATIISVNAAGTVVNNLIQGIYQFQLTVTDNDGASSSDIAQITVNAAINKLPVANAGVDQVITLPVNSTTLTGSGTDADGTIINYAWVKISGPATGTISTPSSASTSINNLVQGVYQYRLIVTDNSGAIAAGTIKITVNAAINLPPVANAGADKVITLPTNSVTVTGSGTDADGTISSYLWMKISGPAAGSISSLNSATTAINNLIEGVYYYQFTVTDNSGAKSNDTIKVTVIKAPNQAPLANAGLDKIITLPVNTTTLSGVGTDVDGIVVSFAWVKITGPAIGLIVSPTAAITTLNNLVQGVYQYQLTVTDNDGAISRDTVTVTINPAANKPPVAKVGADQVITLPVNTATLSGSGTDSDGTIIGYHWTKVSGPVSGNIVSPNNAGTVVNNLAQGIYLYAVTVTDNSGATATDTLKLTVNKAPNKAPVANAGVDKIITLPTSSTTLSGSGSDADGTIAGMSWVKIAGPATGSIASPNQALTAINSLVQGVYQFELTVTDNDGAVGKDTVQVTVNAPSNLPPTANAGPDKIIVLPVNSTVLTGSGTDPDGTVVKYAWVKISGPVTGSIALPNSAVTVIGGLVKGVYQYELTVTDNNGATATDTVKVTVNGATNLAPVANAGPDVFLVLPDNFTPLNGSGTDADGTIVSYLWKVVKGPAGYNLPNADQPTTQVLNLFQGIYEVELTVVDNNGLEGKDTMKITVAAPRLSNFNNEAKIYPNPVKDIATVNITTINAASKLSVSVYSAIGMQVKYNEFYASGNTTLYKLDMTNLSDAYYFVVIRFDDGSKLTYKIFKSAAN